MTRSSRFLSAAANSSATPAPETPVESDFAIILAALLCALICIVGFIAVARCSRLHRRSVAYASPITTHPLANKGIKKKIVEALPKFTYEDGGGKSSAGDCAICLAEYADGDEIRVLPQCGHGFHVGCIDTWLDSHASCPSCRQVLVMTRCRKCGGFPTVSAEKIPSDMEGKGGEENDRVR